MIVGGRDYIKYMYMYVYHVDLLVGLRLPRLTIILQSHVQYSTWVKGLSGRVVTSVCVASAWKGAVAVTTPNKMPVSVEKFAFGKCPSGQEVQGFLLSNKHGMQVSLISYGAAIWKICIPDK